MKNGTHPFAKRFPGQASPLLDVPESASGISKALKIQLDKILETHMFDLRTHLDSWMLRQEVLFSSIVGNGYRKPKQQQQGESDPDFWRSFADAEIPSEMAVFQEASTTQSVQDLDKGVFAGACCGYKAQLETLAGDAAVHQEKPPQKRISKIIIGRPNENRKSVERQNNLLQNGPARNQRSSTVSMNSRASSEASLTAIAEVASSSSSDDEPERRDQGKACKEPASGKPLKKLQKPVGAENSVDGGEPNTPVALKVGNSNSRLRASWFSSVTHGVSNAVEMALGPKGFLDFEAVYSERRGAATADTKNDSEDTALHSRISQDYASEFDSKKRKMARQVSVMKSLQPRSRFTLHRGGTRNKIRQFVRGNSFEVLCSFLILSNALFVGVEVEYTAQQKTKDVPFIFYLGGHAYAVLFAIELALRLVADGPLPFLGCGRKRSSSVCWNYLDMFIVISSVVEMVMDFMRMNGTQVADVHETSNIRIARVMKITRLLRAVRVLRVVRVLRALRTLVYGIMCTLKSMIWSMLLLFLVMYIFGIIFTQAATEKLMLGEDYETALYWGTLPKSVYTLFQVISNGLSWEEPMEPLSRMAPFYVALLIVFVAFTMFAMLNVMTGVFCQSAIESAQHDYDLAVHAYLSNKEAYLSKIREVFSEIDDAACGEVHLDKFEEYLENEQVRAYFASLGLEPNDAWTLFKLLDRDGTCILDLEEFMWGCLRLRGPASALELAKLDYESKVLGKAITATLRRIESRIPEGPETCSMPSAHIGHVASATKQCPVPSDSPPRPPMCFPMSPPDKDTKNTCDAWAPRLGFDQDMRKLVLAL